MTRKMRVSGSDCQRVAWRCRALRFARGRRKPPRRRLIARLRRNIRARQAHVFAALRAASTGMSIACRGSLAEVAARIEAAPRSRQTPQAADCFTLSHVQRGAVRPLRSAFASPRSARPNVFQTDDSCELSPYVPSESGGFVRERWNASCHRPTVAANRILRARYGREENHSAVAAARQTGESGAVRRKASGICMAAAGATGRRGLCRRASSPAVAGIRPRNADPRRVHGVGVLGARSLITPNPNS